MNIVASELIKLERSHSLTVVLLLPVVIACVGTFNTILSGEHLHDGWNTLWLRTVVFYGLFPLTLGIAVLASSIWRVEHRGGNWNALMSGPVPAARIVVAKTSIIAVLAAAMQMVMVATVIAIGKLVFDLDGTLPAPLWAASVLIVAASIPLAALQSGLSMVIGSFALPIAIALAGAAVSVLLLTAEVGGAIFVLPYTVTTRATQLATGTFGDSGTLTAGAVIAVAGASAILTLATTFVFSRVLDRRDVRP